MKRGMKFFAWMMVVVLLCGSVMAGCGSGKDAPAAQPEEKASEEEPAEQEQTQEETGDDVFAGFGITPLAEPSTIDLGYFSGALYSAIIYGADQKGWFEEAGLTLNYQSFESGPAMMEANANWDVGISGAPGVLNGLVGYDVKCISVVDYEQEQCLYVRPDSPIAQSGTGNIEGYPLIYGTAEDWKGTTWIMPVGTTIYMVFLDTLNKIGLTLDDVTIINMDVSGAKSAFLGGQADGIGCWNTIALSIEDEGCVKAASAADGSILASGMVATDEALENKFDEVKIFFEVFVKAQDYFAEHRDEYAAYMYETCVEEGVSCTEDTAERLIETYAYLPSETVISNACNEIEDGKGTAGRMISQTEADLLVMLDFFIEQGSYTEENRSYILDNGCVDSSIAEAAAADFGLN